ncbi:MAG TPA: alcohol dehydrogenase catalytic domain-containing protein [Bryobacteraceae bacterium]|jgi:threonine dehydrogenase-like Zn-dependent dehydrogenase|nr:alcohol dehydrogenase catalytic domain-containing protein [Bryobacteraceae bacterium]
MPVALKESEAKQQSRDVMRANVFRGPGRFGLEEKAIPKAGFGEAVMKVRLTTICGTDIHIVRGEFRVREGLTIGHEAVGVIHELGPGVTGYSVGQRVLAGAITPCGQCEACLAGNRSQCGGPLGGWRLGNTMDGTQAEYVLIPHAQANLALIPEALSDEQVLLLADIASTGFAAAESGRIRLGDTVAVFAQGPIGLCATLGAHLMGASEIIAVDSDPQRLKMAQRFGATAVILAEADPLAEIRDITEGRGVDVAIEALGIQETFENALRALRPGGILSSVGVYSGHLNLPLDAIGAGLADQRIVTTLCPGGKERMSRLMRLVRSRRVDLTPLLTHVFSLEEIKRAYELFESRRDGVLKIGIRVE